MKSFKKGISITLMLIMGIFLSACGGNSPKSQVEKYLDDLVQGKKYEINNMVTDAINKSIFGTTENYSEEIQGGMTSETEKLLNEIVKNMEYKINEEKVSGEKATVNVTVKGGNISKAFMGYLGDMLTLAYTSDILSTTPQEEYVLLANSVFYEKLKNIEYDERTISINLIKEKNLWEVENDEYLYELLLGNTGAEEVSKDN